MHVHAAVTAPEQSAGILWSLLLLFFAAKVFEILFDRLGQPRLIGQIIAGFLVGPSVLHWVQVSPTLDFMAEIGVIFLLFEAGLHTQPEDILQHGYVSLGVAVFGVITPLVGGWLFAIAIGENTTTAHFVGTLLTATSVGITTKILTDYGALDTAFGRVIIGAAVIDDILGLLALSTLSSFAGFSVPFGTRLTPRERMTINLLLTLFFAALFLGVVLLLRRTAYRWFAARVASAAASPLLWSFSLILLLLLSAVSASIGMAAIIGAFLAGMFLSGVPQAAESISSQARAVSSFVVPFFLANIGMRASPHELASRRVLLVVAALTLLAAATKLLACSAAALPLGARSAWLVGIGMIPRGEVGIVVAGQSLRLAKVPDSYYDVGIAVAILTSMLGAMVMRAMLRHPRPVWQR